MKPLRIAVVGLGRIGRIHAQHVHELASEQDRCELTALVDIDIGQIEVSRNHVSGYRVETWIFGEKGQIHVGRFEQKPSEVTVETYGLDRPIDRKVFTMRDYGADAPEFVGRFGLAYKAELTHFVERCNQGLPFSVDHNDGLRAMEVIDAALRSRWDPVKIEGGGESQ